MKKAFSLILALVLCLGLCACGGTIGTPGTELTLDNYTDYMKVCTGIGYTDKFDGDDIWFGKHSGGYKEVLSTFATSLDGYIWTDNVATNFNYENVKVTVRFTGTVSIVDKDSGTDEIAQVSELPFEFENTFGLMVSGESKGDRAYYELPLPSNMVAINDDLKRHGNDFMIKYTAEVVAVSGVAKPA